MKHQIEQWSTDHPRWVELAAMMAEVEQSRYLNVLFEWHIDAFVFVALADREIVGFLRYCTQPIGPDEDCATVLIDGVPLLEGKVIGFYVREAWRRQGFGRNLQQTALTHARQQGCYQFRSFSAGDKTANHQLKLSMGFAIQPTIRRDDNAGLYFIMPLQVWGQN